MKKKNREINIFSMSALDLFASALGAFILISLILFPYYLKVDQKFVEENERLKKQLEKLQKENKAKDKQIIDLKDELKNSQKEVEDLQSKLKDAVKFSLLGLKTKAESFVLVMDMSGSMKQYEDIMRNTMDRLIEPLGDKNAVQIIGYQGVYPDYQLHSWNTPTNMYKMTSTNKTYALNYADGLVYKFDGGTPTRLALLEALKYSDAEAIILLTDGAPNSDPYAIIDEVTSINNGKKEIHTVAIGNYRDKKVLTEFLINLAEKNRGNFIGVSQ
jgi:cell division protein FtsB